ncbi:MAG: dTDP-4-amino-4,6-dideoxygalactose transaminase [Planctomycetota bacterium]
MRREPARPDIASPLGSEPAIPLHRPHFGPEEEEAAHAVLASGRLSGGGVWLEKAEALLRARTGARHALLTSSCTHALETAALALAIAPGDEVIVPSWGFPTSASAFLRQGARIVFADSRPDDPEVDLDDVMRRVTPRTRAIVLVHYAGRPCDAPALRERLGDDVIAIVEDAAQAFDARLRGRACGTLGTIGCISFHGTKNLTCGEGGVFLTDDDDIAHRASLIREMGTDRRLFLHGEVSRYSWRTLGSSYLPPEISAAILCAQIEKADRILERRLAVADRYHQRFAEAQRRGDLFLPRRAPDGESNGHIYWVAFRSQERRDRAARALAAVGVEASSHFHPLDASPFGQVLHGGLRALPNAERFHRCLLRLPIYPDLGETEQELVMATLLASLG